jgi:hypothetical protein
VKVFSGADLANPAVGALTPTADFDGIQDPNAGGAVVAVGDVNADRVPDLVAGAGAGPRVAVWDGTSLRAGQTPSRLVNDFYAPLTGGVNVAVGDMNGDRYAEVLASNRAGHPMPGNNRLKAIDGQSLVQSGSSRLVVQFETRNVGSPSVGVGDPNSRGELRVAVKRLDFDLRADLLLSHSDSPRVTTILGKDITSSNPGAASLSGTWFNALDPVVYQAEFTSGLWVG